MRILVVDDERGMRMLLDKILVKWGHEVFTASDGLEALAILEKEKVQLVVSDWAMPRLDGLELCRRIRATPFPGYVYIIILTAKDSKGELVTAMEMGADDFIAKPFDANELDVRIRAGERILNLERDLEDRNKKLSNAYSIMRKDIEAAAKMQKDLLPRPGTNLSGFSFDWIFLPCSFVAGDTFNYMVLDKDHACFFLLDVSGHGVPAAMLSFTLTKTLTNLIFPGRPCRDPGGIEQERDFLSPASAVHELNMRFQADDENMQYFTMIYGLLDARDGRVTFTQAGQPPPIHMRKSAGPMLVGSGGFPVGLNPDATFEDIEFHLDPGDRIILYSDGITECTNKDGQEFSTERLVDLLHQWQALPLRALMEKVETSLREWRGSDELEDDISLLAIERCPA
jgi:sigma-B regulation protein RsbU (phosphoserine phosphatase)